MNRNPNQPIEVRLSLPELRAVLYGLAHDRPYADRRMALAAARAKDKIAAAEDDLKRRLELAGVGYTAD